jgi:hypothetical protein
VKQSLADRQCIPELAAAILHAAVVNKNSPEVVRLCFPHIPTIKTHPLYNTGKVLQAVHAAVLKSLYEQRFSPETDPSPFAILAGVTFAQATFAGVPSRFWEQACRPADKPPRPVLPGDVMTLPTLLDADVKFEPEKGGAAGGRPSNEKGGGGPPTPPPHLERERTITMGPRKPAAPPQEPVVPKLTALAMKKGGKFAGQGRKRLFEFSNINRCLVWRGEKENDVIKGAIGLDPQTKAERAGAVLTIKTAGKSHQIQFETDTRADEWLKAIIKAIPK